MRLSSMVFPLFCTAAVVAIGAMVVTSRSRQITAVSQTVASNPPATPPAGAAPQGPGVPGEEPPAGVGVPPGYRGTNARNYMRMRLRELTVAEEYFYNETQSYTTDMSKLQLQKRTGDPVVLRVISAGPAGWSGEATNPALPGKSCVTYAGVVSSSSLPSIPQTAFDHAQPLGERDMVCDKP